MNKILEFKDVLYSDKGIRPTRDIVEFTAHRLVTSSEPNRVLGNPNIPNPFQVKAHINHGRWIVHCPNDDCFSASYVDFNNLIFMCTECWNRDFNSEWLIVVKPEDKKEIEDKLLEREQVRNRNWNPGTNWTGKQWTGKAESIGQLKKQAEQPGGLE
jgi:hypothetical protein